MLARMGSSASGRRGIPLETAHRIQLLLRQGWPKCLIARECRVARCTVFRIAAGTHWSSRDGAPRLVRCACGALFVPPRSWRTEADPPGPCLACRLVAERPEKDEG